MKNKIISPDASMNLPEMAPSLGSTSGGIIMLKNFTKTQLQHKRYMESKRKSGSNHHFNKPLNQRKALRKYYLKNKHKRNAQVMVYNSIKSGILKKENCFICNEIKTEAHHNNYDKPLDVIWLCRKCHHHIHRLLRVKKEFCNG